MLAAQKHPPDVPAHAEDAAPPEPPARPSYLLALLQALGTWNV
jgi:hypothetical protein